MTREQYLIKYGKEGRNLNLIPQAKFDWLKRYHVFKREKKNGRTNTEALFIVVDECYCDYITAYKSISFFINFKTKKEK
jgi:hypothetical protein